MKKKEQPIAQEAGNPNHLDQEYEFVVKSIKKYIDERFQNLPDHLLQAPVPHDPRPEGGTKNPLPSSNWRLYAYFLLIQIFLLFLVWRVWGTPSVQAPTGDTKVQEVVLVSRLLQHRVDLYFLVLSGVLAVGFWRMQSFGKALRQLQGRPQAVIGNFVPDGGPIPMSEPCSALESSVPNVSSQESLWRNPWQSWLSFGEQRRNLKLKKFVNKEQALIKVWLTKIISTDDLSSNQIENRIKNSALAWRQVWDRGGCLDEEAEECVRVVFQFMYARWATQYWEGGRNSRVTGRAGAVPRKGLEAFLQAKSLKFKKADPENYKLQIAVLQRCLEYYYN